MRETFSPLSPTDGGLRIVGEDVDADAGRYARPAPRVDLGKHPVNHPRCQQRDQACTLRSLPKASLMSPNHSMSNVSSAGCE